ncbi:MAG TPA: hypothetical protein VMV90_10710 [Rectinemataceae bacterium]|nr:hypothetical protein [Rectinemataceae bacterium]
MELKFYKLRLCDSDLILIDDLDSGGRDREWEKVARELLDRRRGVGADRLVVLAQAERDIWLRVFRPEGEGAAAADAALCAARYLLDSGRSGSDRVRMRLSASEGRALDVDVLDAASLGVSLGPPRRVAHPEGGEALGLAEAAAQARSIEASGQRFLVLPLAAGIPAADGVAVFTEGGASRVRARIAAPKRSEAPKALSVHVVSRGELRVAPGAARGALDACAAAALALAASAAVGYADREAVVRMRGGALWIEWGQSGSLYAAGRPEYVYRGEYHLVEDEG